MRSSLSGWLIAWRSGSRPPPSYGVNSHASGRNSPRELLVIKPSSLGDVVHTLPAVALLKRHFPAARLRWLVNPEWEPLLEGNPHVDEVIVFPRAEFRRFGAVTRFLPWARRFGQEHESDLVLDFQGLLRSGLLARFARRTGSGRIVGLSDAREGAGFFYDQQADVRAQAHAVDRYLALVHSLGIPISRPLEWPLPKGSAVPGLDPGFILLHPFSRGNDKSLSIGDVVSICHELAPLQVVIAGRAQTDVPTLANTIGLLNRTSLSQLIWLIRQARFVVSVDSGPMHIAAAITHQLLSIHTWSDPRKVGPYNPRAWVWKSGALQPMSAYLPGGHPAPPSSEDARLTLAQTIAKLVTNDGQG